jgi:leucine-rich repeat protein SHOC2
MVTLNRLTHLKLDHNDLEGHKVGVFPVGLQHLDLSFNHIQNLPANVLNCVILQHLDLNQNRLATIAGIEVLVLLVELILDDNNLTEIPPEISALCKLRHLSLKNNKLSNAMPLPPGLFTDTAVLNIELSGNKDLSKGELMRLEGVDVFLERRKACKNKAISGGGMLSDELLFGLD